MTKKHIHLSCPECGARCCQYVATEIDTPTSKREYDYIRWYLRHKDVNVFKDHDGQWFLEFQTRCEELAEDGRCLAYETRPRICREHGEDGQDCEFGDEDAVHALLFETAAEFERYLDKRGVDWRWKR